MSNERQIARTEEEEEEFVEEEEEEEAMALAEAAAKAREERLARIEREASTKSEEEILGEIERLEQRMAHLDALMKARQEKEGKPKSKDELFVELMNKFPGQKSKGIVYDSCLFVIGTIAFFGPLLTYPANALLRHVLEYYTDFIITSRPNELVIVLLCCLSAYWDGGTIGIGFGFEAATFFSTPIINGCNWFFYGREVALSCSVFIALAAAIGATEMSVGKKIRSWDTSVMLHAVKLTLVICALTTFPIWLYGPLTAKVWKVNVDAETFKARQRGAFPQTSPNPDFVDNNNKKDQSWI